MTLAQTLEIIGSIKVILWADKLSITTTDTRHN